MFDLFGLAAGEQVTGCHVQSGENLAGRQSMLIELALHHLSRRLRRQFQSRWLLRIHSLPQICNLP